MMPASAGILPALASALDPPALPLRFGKNRRCGRRRLGSRATGRLWRTVAPARPFARIAPSRRLRVRHRRPCRAPTGADSFLRSGFSPTLRSRACVPSAQAPWETVNFSRAAPALACGAQAAPVRDARSRSYSFRNCQPLISPFYTRSRSYRCAISTPRDHSASPSLRARPAASALRPPL